MKQIHRLAFYSTDHSMMFLKTNICSLFPHFFIISSGYPLNIFFFFNFLSSSRHQSNSSPVAKGGQISVLRQLTIRTLLQSSGILSSSQINLKMSCKSLTVVSISAFIISSVGFDNTTPPPPTPAAALPFLMSLMKFLISSLVTVPSSISCCCHQQNL